MDFFNLLTMLGGLALFLFGMHMLSEGLEKLSGGRLEQVLENLTNNLLKAVLLGAGVTAVIQSSSAATVMAVGFVNSGIMKLSQAVGIIMGANVGTTVTSWLLSLTGIEGGNFWVRLAKPASFSPILAIIGVIFIMFLKNGRKRDIGTVFVGFAILMFGMDTMSSAMEPLSGVPQFTQLFVLFTNPVLGMLAGALLTAVLQSSSASVGILQALCGTGTVTYAAAVPIILGQNIGTCVTAVMSGVGVSKNAKRVAMVHLLFNVIGTVLFMVVFYAANAAIRFGFLGEAANRAGIAAVHTGFNIAATLALLPFAGTLERLSMVFIKPDEGETQGHTDFARLDERFLGTPSFALGQANTYVVKMAQLTKASLDEAMELLFRYDRKGAGEVEQMEKLADRYDDEVSGYLAKLSGRDLGGQDSRRLTMLLHSVGDLERISDHALNIAGCAMELDKRGQSFSAKATEELRVFSSAVLAIVEESVRVFETQDGEAARAIEPFEEAVNLLQKEMKRRHMKRLQKGKCTAELGFVLSDVTNNFERIAAHCSNLAINVMQLYEDDTQAHAYVDRLPKEEGSEFDTLLQAYLAHYELP